MSNEETRKGFVIEKLFEQDQICLTYTDVDRAIVGGCMPSKESVLLPTPKELAANYFLERREMGVINIGSSGKVTVDGTTYGMSNKDSLYLGRGSKEVTFSSNDATNPAKFYFVSYPAHQSFPTTLVAQADANKLEMGDQEHSNKRWS